MGGTLETSGRVTRPVQMSEMVEEDGLGGGPRSQQSHPEIPGARTRALAHTPARACTPGGNRKQRKRSQALMQCCCSHLSCSPPSKLQQPHSSSDENDAVYDDNGDLAL
ncbi:hypothetical protein C0Q70_04887 [Pomacea canaliculata]|uniref:Uncharacterized protein n=1 Tax=Pomacea canaliculata TaxID=400727 RepID=A0A2T7PJL5_POMCA|nr:hypothetical protein C0Q70_04887 [Pomacea canaliculata]